MPKCTLSHLKLLQRVHQDLTTKFLCLFQFYYMQHHSAIKMIFVALKPVLEKPEGLLYLWTPLRQAACIELQM